MIATNSTTEFILTVTEEERTQLLNFLEQKLKKKLIEEHRTDTADFRKYVVHQEEILESLIHKLRRD
jgi:hypothetical protein